MMESLRQGMISSFIAQFSVYHGLPVEFVHDAVSQIHGKTLAHLCRGLNIGKPDFMSIFLLTHKIRSRGEKAVDQNMLAAAIQAYCDADPDLCRQLIVTLRH